MAGVQLSPTLRPLADWLVLLPLADGVCVAYNDLVHPGEGLGEQHRSLKEAYVATVLCQCEYHILLLFWKERGWGGTRGEKKKYK